MGMFLLCSGLSFTSFLPKTEAYARDIINIVNFKVTAGGNSVGSARKRNSSETVINLSETKYGKKVIVTNYRKSDNKNMGGVSMKTGTRVQFSDSSVKGKDYYLKLKRNSNVSNFIVYGSWSPDEY